jgi:2-polyprenyl-3-methyl-5-hydroxy-6-metoxy-1,4-benzoquinol methylase
MKRLALFLFALCPSLFADEASDILSQSGVKGGIVVHVGCGDGTLTQKLRANESYQVQGLTKEADKVPAIRDRSTKPG